MQYRTALVSVYFNILTTMYVCMYVVPSIFYTFRCVATTLALIISHNSNYNIRSIRSTFSASTAVCDIYVCDVL
jgi:hypothetical protein